MNKLFLSFFVLFSYWVSVLAEQFFYPVCSVDRESMLVIYQRDIDDLELLLCGKDAGVAIKELSSLFIPSQVKLIPGASGFSFLDRGRIRLKHFTKRAPATIDIVEPIDSILSMEWIDSNNFYFVGRYKGCFNVFLCNATDIHCPEVSLIAGGDHRDYLYPCKIDDRLFCVSKSKLGNYFITDLPWDHREFEAFRDIDVVFESDHPICFLHMKSLNFGFFLQYVIDEASGLLSFSCFSVEKSVEDRWLIEKLFDFKLPATYLVGSSMKRVYESITPFLPNYENFPKIYFVDYDLTAEYSYLRVFDFSSKENKLVDLPVKKNVSSKGIFSPMIIGAKLYYGLISDGYFPRSEISLDEEVGCMTCQVPFVDLNS